MKLTQEQIQSLSAIDRDMDSGAQPFVRDENGGRWAFSAAVMHQCGCASGQTASRDVLTALMTANIADLDRQRRAH